MTGRQELSIGALHYAAVACYLSWDFCGFEVKKKFTPVLARVAPSPCVSWAGREARERESRRGRTDCHAPKAAQQPHDIGSHSSSMQNVRLGFGLFVTVVVVFFKKKT